MAPNVTSRNRWVSISFQATARFIPSVLRKFSRTLEFLAGQLTSRRVESPVFPTYVFSTFWRGRISPFRAFQFRHDAAGKWSLRSWSKCQGIWGFRGHVLLDSFLNLLKCLKKSHWKNILKFKFLSSFMQYVLTHNVTECEWIMKIIDAFFYNFSCWYGVLPYIYILFYYIFHSIVLFYTV